MITLVQRVTFARVRVDGQTVGEIARGLLLYVGVEHGDGPAEADSTARKVAQLRCFAGRTPMDQSVVQAQAGCLVVSQFTLAAELAQGNRPSFTDAAPPEVAEPLYRRVAEQMRGLGISTATGTFGASMQVESCNDGPATFVLVVRGGRIVARPPRPTAPPTTS